MSPSDSLQDSRFHFDASAGNSAARWPTPPMQRAACELLQALLEHAFLRGSSLRHRHHALRVNGPQERIAAALVEILRVPFAMPAEGGELCVPTLDVGVLDDGVVRYTVGELYAAYLQTITPVERPGQARDELLYVDERERALIIAGLRTLHRDRNTALTCHTLHALTHGLTLSSRATFGLLDTEALLSRLGATYAPT